jgi:hypothetical protein
MRKLLEKLITKSIHQCCGYMWGVFIGNRMDCWVKDVVVVDVHVAAAAASYNAQAFGGILFALR